MLSKLIVTLAIAVLLVDGLLLRRLVPEYRDLQRRRNAKLGGASDLGADETGRPILPNSRVPVALFVLHRDRVAAELATLDRLRTQIPQSAADVVGYCDSVACLEAIRSSSIRPHFPIAAYGSYTLNRVLLQCDRAGEFAVVSPVSGKWTFLRVPDSKESWSQLERILGTPR